MAEIEFNRQARIHIHAGSYPSSAIEIQYNTTIGVQYPPTSQGNIDKNGYSGIKNIVSGSMQLTKTLSDSNIQYGALIASEFSCQFYHEITENYPVDKPPFEITKGSVIEVTVGDYDVETDTFSNAIFFSGYIDVCSRDVDNENYYTITAYDWSYYNRNKDISDKWNTLIDYIHENSVVTIPVWRLLTLTTKLLFTNDYSNIVITDYTDFADLNIYVDLDATKLPYVDNLSIEDYLRWVGELLGVCFEPYTSGLELQEENATWFVYPKSQIRVVRINESQEAISLVNNIEKHNSSTESYVTENVSGVQVYNGSDLLYATGTDDNPYKIYDNPFFGYLVEPQDFVDDLLTRIDEITFTPCNLKLIVSNPGIQLGDKITYELGKTYHSRVLQMIYSGILFVDEEIICNALGEKLQQEDMSKYNGGGTVDLTEIEKKLETLDDNAVKIDGELQTIGGDTLLNNNDLPITVKTKNSITDILDDALEDYATKAYVSENYPTFQYIADRYATAIWVNDYFLKKIDFATYIQNYIHDDYLEFTNPSAFIELRTVEQGVTPDEIVRISLVKNLSTVHMSIVLKLNSTVQSGKKIFGIIDSGIPALGHVRTRVTAKYSFDTMGSIGAGQNAGARSFYFRRSTDNETGDTNNVTYVINTYDDITVPQGEFTYIRLSATWIVQEEEE